MRRSESPKSLRSPGRSLNSPKNVGTDTMGLEGFERLKISQQRDVLAPSRGIGHLLRVLFGSGVYVTG
jgi:hypothetical protein